MLIHLKDLIPWFTHYKYWIIFPIAVIEGPIITIISGFLVSIGQLNFISAYLVVAAGDVVGDSLYYYIGRFGRHGFLHKYGKRFGFTLERLKKIERHFERHSTRTLIISKFAQGIGSLAWIASGIARVPFKKFLGINTVTTAIKSMILLLVGFYFGESYEKFNSYLNIIGLVMLCLVIAYVLVVNSDLFKKFIDKSED